MCEGTPPFASPRKAPKNLTKTTSQTRQTQLPTAGSKAQRLRPN